LPLSLDWANAPKRSRQADLGDAPGSLVAATLMAGLIVGGLELSTATRQERRRTCNSCRGRHWLYMIGLVRLSIGAIGADSILLATLKPPENPQARS
jgi:hypothetical protein